MTFSTLTLEDLLEARDLYHVHLTKKENVVATAIGRYRIRKKDKDAKRAEAVDVERIRQKVVRSSARTLANSEVKPWSWPCILVFVKEWAQKGDFHARPDQMIPYYLYLPDGRMVPTCVVLAETNNAPVPPLTGLQFPPQLIGGGYPVLTTVQGQQRVGSLACLVTDGLAVYALTNRHVTGLPGQDVTSVIAGRETLLGKSATTQLARKPFCEVFEGWPGAKTFVNIDAGLIRVDDLSRWTAQVFGIGELDEMIDLYIDTLSLDWLGRRVRAFGAASGQLQGVIQGFFYRYRAMGGEESVAELLIGPEDETKPLPSVPGDSGTLWFVESPGEDRLPQRGKRAERWRPLAMQWGGHRFLTQHQGDSYQFVLATSLSTICRELDVEIVRDWNIGHSEYWGKVGHYQVAAKACGVFSAGALKDLFRLNQDRISFAESDISNGTVKKFSSHEFVPLADVADLVWRTTRKSDANNHFADMDAPSETFGGKTLLELCKDPKQITPAIWIDFYKSIHARSHGALPFRVWQGFDEMVAAVKKGDVTRYICLAGTMAHYVGDACQPLHVSQYHHGTNAAEHDVHEVYETRMLDRNAAELVAGVNKAIGSRRAKLIAKNGHEAAVATVKLMQKTFAAIKPLDIVKLYNESSGIERVPYMWSKLKTKTCAVIADGALCLASLWQSAWEAGQGSSIPLSKIKAVDKAALVKLYNTPTFYVSLSLTKVAPLLKGGPK